MIVDPFDIDKHGHHIEKWLEGHKLNSDRIEDLPECGFIAHEESVGYAAGFLRHFEGCPYVFIEGLIANPQFLGKKRHHAINLVVQQIIKKSRQLGVKKILAYSKDSAALKRSERFGFHRLPHVLIGLDLGE